MHQKIIIMLLGHYSMMKNSATRYMQMLYEWIISITGLEFDIKNQINEQETIINQCIVRVFWEFYCSIFRWKLQLKLWSTFLCTFLISGRFFCNVVCFELSLQTVDVTFNDKCLKQHKTKPVTLIWGTVPFH